jgi:hypothetical protein
MMLKFVILLDCDECGHSPSNARVSSTPKLEAWEFDLRTLIHNAECAGWRVMRDYSICPECIQAELTMADWLQEPEDNIRA